MISCLCILIFRSPKSRCTHINMYTGLTKDSGVTAESCFGTSSDMMLIHCLDKLLCTYLTVCDSVFIMRRQNSTADLQRNEIQYFHLRKSITKTKCKLRHLRLLHTCQSVLFISIIQSFFFLNSNFSLFPKWFRNRHLDSRITWKNTCAERDWWPSQLQIGAAVWPAGISLAKTEKYKGHIV